MLLAGFVRTYVLQIRYFNANGGAIRHSDLCRQIISTNPRSAHSNGRIPRAFPITMEDRERARNLLYPIDYLYRKRNDERSVKLQTSERTCGEQKEGAPRRGRVHRFAPQSSSTCTEPRLLLLDIASAGDISLSLNPHVHRVRNACGFVPLAIIVIMESEAVYKCPAFISRFRLAILFLRRSISVVCYTSETDFLRMR